MRGIEKSETDKIKIKLDAIDTKIDEKDKEQTELQNTVDLNRQGKVRIKDLRNQVKDLNIEKSNLKTEIDSIEVKTERKIANFKKQQELKGSEKKNENKDNSFFFIIISTLIELVILFGVYFNEYYKYRSYSDFKAKIDKDENFQKWHNYNSLLEIIFNQDTKINDKLPSMKVISDLCKVNGNIFLNKDLTTAFKLFGTLGIIRTGGSAKYIAKSKDSAVELLRKHFNIE